MSAGTAEVEVPELPEAMDMDSTPDADAEISESGLPQDFQDELDKLDDEHENKSDSDGDDESNSVADPDEEAAADDSKEKESGSEEGASNLTWSQERSRAKELGINTKGMKRSDVQEKIRESESESERKDAEFNELKEQAKAAGLTDLDLTGVESASELKRVLTVLDRQSLSQKPQDQVSTTDQEEAAKDDEPVKLSEEIEAQLKEISETYEAPELADLVRGLYEQNQTTEQRVNQLLDHADAQQATTQAETDTRDDTRFHELVGELGYSDVFGEIGEALDVSGLSQEQLGNRQTIFETWHRLSEGDRSKITKGEIGRALRASFPDQFDKKQKSENAAKIRAQSKKRRGSGGRNVSKQPHDGPLENDPELMEAYERLSQESN
jgi:hypothetical protein